jgi:hypothetical protein
MHMYVCDYRGSCVCESLGTRADSRIVLFASLMTELEAHQWPSGQQHRPGKKERECARWRKRKQCPRACGANAVLLIRLVVLTPSCKQQGLCSRLVVCLQNNEQYMVPYEKGECDRRGSACARPCSRPCAAGQSCFIKAEGSRGGGRGLFSWVNCNDDAVLSLSFVYH